jgi:hypothetical protein
LQAEQDPQRYADEYFPADTDNTFDHSAAMREAMHGRPFANLLDYGDWQGKPFRADPEDHDGFEIRLCQGLASRDDLGRLPKVVLRYVAIEQLCCAR